MPALVANGLSALLPGVLPALLLSALRPELVKAVSKYLDPYLAVLLPGASFTVLLVAVSLLEANRFMARSCEIVSALPIAVRSFRTACE